MNKLLEAQIIAKDMEILLLKEKAIDTQKLLDEIEVLKSVIRMKEQRYEDELAKGRYMYNQYSILEGKYNAEITFTNHLKAKYRMIPKWIKWIFVK